MRHILIIFYLIIAISSFGQKKELIDDERIDLLVNKVQNNTISDQEKKELRNLTFKIQNQGFRLDERSNDYKGSLEYIDRALSIWIASRDTINEANNRKYRGYLLGRLSKFSKAKREINLAIELFQLVNIDYGVAVSYFDISKVYEYENKLDSALFFNDKALSFWKTKSDTFRILTINNQMISLHSKSEDYIRAKRIYDESVKLLKCEDLHWHPLVDFYCVSFQLFDKLNETNQALRYKKLYTNRINLLKKENIVFESTYKKLSP